MNNFADIHNLNVHYARDGLDRGGPPLVLINSLGTDYRIWDGVIDHLKVSSPVLRYDKRGHGLSDAPPAPYSIGDFSGDLSGLLDFLGITEIVLAGISVGGMIALDCAIKFPDLVHLLILMDTGAKIGTAAYWSDRIEAVRQKGLEPMADAILERWFSPAFIENNSAAYRGYKKMLTRTPSEGYIGTCAALRDADLREQAGSVRSKTLILTGSDDLSTPRPMSEELLGLLPDARSAVIAGAGHLSCIEQPKLVADEMNDFMGRRHA